MGTDVTARARAAYDFDHPNSIDNNALVECLQDLRVSGLLPLAGCMRPVHAGSRARRVRVPASRCTTLLLAYQP